MRSCRSVDRGSRHVAIIIALRVGPIALAWAGGGWLPEAAAAAIRGEHTRLGTEGCPGACAVRTVRSVGATAAQLQRTKYHHDDADHQHRVWELNGLKQSCRVEVAEWKLAVALLLFKPEVHRRNCSHRACGIGSATGTDDRCPRGCSGSKSIQVSCQRCFDGREVLAADAQWRLATAGVVRRLGGPGSMGSQAVGMRRRRKSVRPES